MQNWTGSPFSEAFARSISDGRMHAPSAERNAEPLLALIRLYGPKKGPALEIASGTGQHAVKFAEALPDLIWQPTEPDLKLRASIDGWTLKTGLNNIRSAVFLDASSPDWSEVHGGQSMIFLSNLLHLVSEKDARNIIHEAARALAPSGRFFLYGPFLRDGVATSEGDAAFNAGLRKFNAAIGYKDDFEIIGWLHAAGLELVDLVEMPANNLAFVSEKP